MPDGEDKECSNIEDPEKMSEVEREEVAEKVGDALETNFQDLEEAKKKAEQTDKPDKADDKADKADDNADKADDKAKDGKKGKASASGPIPAPAVRVSSFYFLSLLFNNFESSHAIFMFSVFSCSV